ncbi:MAG: hypothetical protein P1U74_06860 [Legionellaceae bacterium]|nr:hypothetical protein [Legionellaceae bacterium]
MTKENTKNLLTNIWESTSDDSFQTLKDKLNPELINNTEVLTEWLRTMIDSADDTENTIDKTRLDYIQKQLTILIDSNPIIDANTTFIDALTGLCNCIKSSKEQTFSSFIKNDLTLAQNHCSFLTYVLFERLLYPNFHGDHHHLLRAAKEHDIPIRTLIPPHLSASDDLIESLQNSPNANFLGALLSYGIGFAPSVLGNIVAARLLSVSPFQRLLISISPTALGGLARLIVADQTIRGHGKEAVMGFLASSTIGLFSIFAIIESVKLEEVSANSLPYGLLLCANVISGLGISAFSAISLSLQSAPDESIDQYAERLKILVSSKPSYMDNLLGNMSRAPSKKSTSAIAGLGNLTPPFTLFLSAALIPYAKLNGFYGLISGITLAGMIASAFLLQNSYLDQLRKEDISEELARYTSVHLGQRSFLSGDLGGSFLKKFENLTLNEKIEIGRGVFNYIVSFGLLLAVGSTGNLTFSQRGVPAGLLSIYTGSIITISSLFRAYFSLNLKHPFINTNIALTGMGVTTAIFASYPLDPGMIFLVMMLFSVFNGIANRSIFDELGHNIHHRMGEAITLAGGVGAWSAFTTSLLFAFVARTNVSNGVIKNNIEQTNTSNEYFVATALCVMSIVLNSIYKCILKPKIMDKEEHTDIYMKQKDQNYGLTLFSPHSNTEYIVFETKKEKEKQNSQIEHDIDLDEEEIAMVNRV